MLLSLTLTRTPLAPASDLGYLLHKNPARVQERRLNFGTATIFYPQVGMDSTTCTLLLDVDPVALSRHLGGSDRPLEPYVNDRPYASGSFLAAALKDAFGTAMTGRSQERQQLADSPLPLHLELPCVTVRGDHDLSRRFFEPLGYTVSARPLPLDSLYPQWGNSPYQELSLSITAPLSQVLRQLYLLLPALDGRKHYFVDESELDKLQRYGAGWLDTHPERETITRRYLRFRDLLQHLERPEGEQQTITVHDQRLDHVAQRLLQSGASSVLDLGCGEGKLLSRLLKQPQFRQLLGVDVSAKALTQAAQRLHLAQNPALTERVRLVQSSLTYQDGRLQGYEAAALVEVIEHLEPSNLSRLEANLFGFAAPKTVIITTPNRDYNATFEQAEQMRHPDHRFEWSRAEFQAWAQRVATQYGYHVHFEDVGAVTEPHGALTQLALFSKNLG